MKSIIHRNSSFFYNVLEDYKRTTSYNSSRIKQDLTKEVSTKSDYCGREIFELLQNAEDEKSDFVEIIVDSTNKVLSVSNGGKECTPFTEEGFCSIMMAEMSPKLASKQTYIGCKGLGFRSILNWAERISIFSSGVCCTFSTEIAQKYWREEISTRLSPENKEQHERFARESLGLDCPVSILAIPEVSDDAESGKDYTTKIEVAFKKECEKSIIEQIDSLSGKVLLFLNNIQTIRLNVNGTETMIRKEKVNANVIRVFDKFYPGGVEFSIFKETGIYDSELNKAYEVCIAYDKQKRVSGNYLYTFFPTKVKIGLPCVIHATFDLNSSRNSLNETGANNWMQGKIASCLTKFACLLAQESAIPSWDYLSMINLNASDQQDFPILCEEIQQLKDGLPLFPTIEEGYCKLADTLHYSETFATFQKDNSVIFGNHLIEGYTDYGIANDRGNLIFLNKINEYSASLQSTSNPLDSIATRANLIYAVSTVTNYFGPLRLLVDNKGELIEKDGKINVGENIEYLPSDMQVSYVNDELISLLIEKFHIEVSNPRRELTRQLKKCQIDVSDMDLNAAKKRIISFTKHEMGIDGFTQLMFALYWKIETTENTGLESMFTDSDFRLLAKDKSRHYPAELVISSDKIYTDSQVLLYDIDEWVELFRRYESVFLAGDHQQVGINFESVRDFFYDTIRISQTVPLEFIPLDYKANGYLEDYSNTLWKSINGYSYYYSETIEEKNSGSYNRYHVIAKSFIDNLENSGKSLSEIIRYIMSDHRAMSELRGHTLYFQQRTAKSEEVKVSYPLYLLRSYEQFKPLSMYIVSEGIILNGDYSMEQELLELAKDNDGQQMLLLLGAHPDISDLSLSELYCTLKTLPERSLKRGVQKLYKSLREAINAKRSDQDFVDLAEDFRKNGTAYCRKDGGKLEVRPVEEIYYWDNEQLPHNILSTKYKLELPNRVGEDSVKAIFGVKLAKDIQILIEDFEENTILENAVADRIKSRIRYFVAYRLQNSREINDARGKKTIADSIRNIHVKVYSSCRLSIDNTIVELNEGDMVSTRENGELVFHVLTSIREIESAIKTPTFCENITEAVCICLKVTSSEMANCFRSILKNSTEENEFISKKDVSRDIWEDVDRALGLSNEEKAFWDTIMGKTHVPLDMNMLTRSYAEKAAYLKNVFNNIVIPDSFTDFSDLTVEDKYHLLKSLAKHGLDSAELLGSKGLSDFYQWWFNQQIMKYKDSFNHHVYKYVSDNADTIGFESIPTWYYDRCMMFTSGEWLNDITNEIRYDILEESQLNDIFRTKFADIFPELNSLSSDDHWHPEMLKPYFAILEKNGLTTSNIDQRDLSYMFFEGYVDWFQEIIKKYATASELDTRANSEADDNDIEFSFGIGHNKTNEKNSNNANKQKHGGRYSSDKEKQNAGMLAEQKVYNYLCKDSRFADVSGCSRNLDPINGNDSLHYDILYSIIENGTKGHCRYLEVKSMSGSSIIMSGEEYQFAAKNAAYYDFAIVKGNAITIIRSPFLPNKQGEILQVIPDTYMITFDIQRLL